MTALSLRPYQHAAVEAVLRHFRRHPEPAMVVLPTGAGKSLVIAELARLARGRVLVLAHVKELVAQNHAKFAALGQPGARFAAGLGLKQTGEPVIFGSVQSVARNLARFDFAISLLIIDECHRIGPDEESQYRQVIGHLQRINPALKVLGLTATPYRLGEGFIYQLHHRGMVQSREPRLFHTCVYELPLRQLIRQGYLTPPRLIDAPVVHYDFSRLPPRQNGLFDEAALNAELKRQARVTPAIVRQVQEYAQERQGVLIFAATVRHAQEVASLLPAEQTALITGDTPQAERDARLADFLARRLKFVVNVAVLTTGFDAPHVDLIAILRPTDSLALYQQMVGRGLRLFPGKNDCLIVDYAGNRHDLYAPEPADPRPAADTVPVQVLCPACGFANQFWGRLDAQGALLEHFGRRCQGFFEEEDGQRQFCDYRFRAKSCPHCGEANDIAARLCHGCQATLADPDDKLKAALALKDAKVIRCAGLSLARVSVKGQPRLRVTYHDEDGASLSESFDIGSPAGLARLQQQLVQRHWHLPGLVAPTLSVEALLAQPACLRHPDFVVARKQGPVWRIVEKIFDYQGRIRLANAL